MGERVPIGDRFVQGCWVFAGVASIAVAIALIAFGPHMAPIRPGSPALFWHFASGVDLDGTGRGNYIPSGDAYIIDDSWVAYEDRNLHGSELCYVSMRDAMARFDEVSADLNRTLKQGDDSPFVQGYAAWREKQPDSHDVGSLVASIKVKLNERRAARGIDSLAFAVSQEQQFWQRWPRAKWYWANFVFEWTFLTGLALWTVWPGIRRRGPSVWAAHAAALPFLFWLPAFLGYASWSFTSAGPSGGIVYPYLLILSRGRYCTNFDQWLLEHTPQILEPLSTPNGSFVSISGGMPGPTSAFVAGLILAVVIFFVASLAQKLIHRLAVPNRVKSQTA